MAPRLPKRTLQPNDLRSDRLIEVINPISDSLSGALAGGVSLDNMRKAVVTAKVTPPDDWVPLEFRNDFTRHPAGTFPVPGSLLYRLGNKTFVRLRGLLARPSAPAFGTVIAPIPTPTAQERHGVDGGGAHALLETRIDGTLTYGSGLVDTLSLAGISYETAEQVPPWKAPVDVTMLGEGGQDYGVPALVLAIGATRADRKPCCPDTQLIWEAPLVGEGKARQRKLRIRRLGGLESGVEHTVRLLALYD